ncbi:MAG: hypothetical protein OZ921_16530 [Sorangiineae bacterium]|nr:hypothetical protein [Polyangiaceae bacterium]MEB2324121.1 hypothetical protein [Sorangiineae bacterium]
MSMKRAKMSAIIAAVRVLSPAAAVVTTLSVAAGLPGCFVFGSPGPSKVGQGQKYSSGNPAFDEFFERLYSLQVALAEAPSGEKEVRRAFAAKLDADPDASTSMLTKKAQKLAQALAARGVGLELELDEGDEETKPTANLKATGAALTGDDRTFITAVETTAQKELDVVHSMKKAAKQLDELRAQLMALETQVDDAFRLGGPRKKAEVRKNLDDAKVLLPLMTSRAEQVRDSAHQLLRKLTQAVRTDDGSFAHHPAPAPAEASPTTSDAEARPKPRPRPAGGAPAPSKPPPSKPPPSKPPPTDFEP